MTGARLLALAVAIATLVHAPAWAQPSQAAKDGKTGNQDYDYAVQAYRTGAKPKIVGGQLAPAKAFPWQASLEVSWVADPYSAHYCGGTIYRATWIITAAHCVRGLGKDDITVSTGANVLQPGIRRVNIARVIPHPAYVHATHDNDIALIELKAPLTLDDATKTATLISTAEEAALAAGSKLTVTGWGATQVGGNSVRDLRFVGVDFVPFGRCNDTFAYDGRITPRMLCAGFDQGQKDSCQGDSGGPLVLAGRPVLAAVVSWGDGCAGAYRYGVYARITPYTGWIAQYIP